MVITILQETNDTTILDRTDELFTCRLLPLPNQYSFRVSYGYFRHGIRIISCLRKIVYAIALLKPFASTACHFLKNFYARVD